jgi:4-amino-4-deoxy-L-arabinose transferase-like glycosyltransferase
MRARTWWLYVILVSALAMRTFHLAYPAWDYHNWRQTITLMVARDFARHDFPLLHPQVSWIGGQQPSAPSYFNAEFSIQSVLAAALYKVFGESDTLARLVAIAFSLLGIYCLYDLLHRRAGPPPARMGAFIYALLPYHLFFGRVFMPDIPALSLALAGLDALDRWTDDAKSARLAAAAALTALAILQKLTVIFVALPALYLFCLVYGRRLLVRKEPYIFALIAGVPAFAWYFPHARAMQPQSVLSALAMQRDLFGHHLRFWLQGPFAGRILKALATEAFSPVGLALALLGLLCAGNGRAAWLFRFWMAGAALTLMSMPGVLPANLYYLSLLLPGGAALGGIALARVARHRIGYPVVAIVLAVFAVGAVYSVLPLYREDRLPRDLGVVLSHLSARGELLATEAGGSPNVLYFADRRGWLLEREYRLERLERLRQAGARYYADTFAADAQEQPQFFNTLAGKFARLTGEDAPWQIYDLAAAPGPLVTLPPGEIQVPKAVNFADEIQFLGLSLRPLLSWPAVFEVNYYWHCMRTPAEDLRVFVHVTDLDGQTVFGQDHWPQAGRLPTSKWKPGDLVRERYVLALPGSLPAARYQIRLGWFDPVGGARLTVLNPGPADREDRALAAELVVPRPPANGWFSP